MIYTKNLSTFNPFKPDFHYKLRIAVAILNF